MCRFLHTLIAIVGFSHDRRARMRARAADVTEPTPRSRGRVGLFKTMSIANAVSRVNEARPGRGEN